MAKGNMLQGMARGKVGDVVFSRLNGEQIARVRNRNPKNPKTNAQLFQRAIMATVMQAYSAGKVIFDHSFQGFAVGDANQRRFMSVNAKHLRSTLATILKQLSNNEAADPWSFNAPGVQCPAFAPFVVSEGDYPNTQMNVITGMPVPQGNEKVKDYVQRIGLVAGDIFTIVGFGANETEKVFQVNGVDSDNATQFKSLFTYVRLQVKDGLGNVDTVVTAESPVTLLFNITGSENAYYNNPKICAVRDEDSDDYWLESSFGGAQTSGALFVAGIIRSRLDMDKRSDCTLEAGCVNYTYEHAKGIVGGYLLQAWKQGAEKIGDSDLILEGGGQ